jgi:hypothetical protein
MLQPIQNSPTLKLFKRTYDVVTNIRLPRSLLVATSLAVVMLGTNPAQALENQPVSGTPTGTTTPEQVLPGVITSGLDQYGDPLPPVIPAPAITTEPSATPKPPEAKKPTIQQRLDKLVSGSTSIIGVPTIPNDKGQLVPTGKANSLEAGISIKGGEVDPDISVSKVLHNDVQLIPGDIPSTSKVYQNTESLQVSTEVQRSTQTIEVNYQGYRTYLNIASGAAVLATNPEGQVLKDPAGNPLYRLMLTPRQSNVGLTTDGRYVFQDKTPAEIVAQARAQGGQLVTQEVAQKMSQGDPQTLAKYGMNLGGRVGEEFADTPSSRLSSTDTSQRIKVQHSRRQSVRGLDAKGDFVAKIQDRSFILNTKPSPATLLTNIAALGPTGFKKEQQQANQANTLNRSNPDRDVPPFTAVVTGSTTKGQLSTDGVKLQTDRAEAILHGQLRGLGISANLSNTTIVTKPNGVTTATNFSIGTSSQLERVITSGREITGSTELTQTFSAGGASGIPGVNTTLNGKLIDPNTQQAVVAINAGTYNQQAVKTDKLIITDTVIDRPTALFSTTYNSPIRNGGKASDLVLTGSVGVQLIPENSQSLENLKLGVLASSSAIYRPGSDVNLYATGKYNSHPSPDQVNNLTLGGNATILQAPGLKGSLGLNYTLPFANKNLENMGVNLRNTFSLTAALNYKDRAWLTVTKYLGGGEKYNKGLAVSTQLLLGNWRASLGLQNINSQRSATASIFAPLDPTTTVGAVIQKGFGGSIKEATETSFSIQLRKSL